MYQGNARLGPMGSRSQSGMRSDISVCAFAEKEYYSCLQGDTRETQRQGPPLNRVCLGEGTTCWVG